MEKREYMGDVTVSVIIPIYNAEKHLEECLHSCLGQALEGIEIICVNDGSTDNTGEILERYRQAHDNVVVLNQKNQGAAMARNLGMAHSRGEFIAFMDSDDYYPDQYALKRLYDAAIENNVLVCGGSLNYVHNGKVNTSNKSRVFRESKMMRYREFQKRGGFTQFLYNAYFLKKNKIEFPNYRRFQDPPFFVEAMAKADEFYVISDCVYMVRNTDKLVNFSHRDVIMGVLQGIGDVLRISRINQFEKLHADMVLELKESYIMLAYKQIYKKDLEIRQCYEKVIEKIDETLLEKDIRNIKKPELMSDHEIIRVVDQSLRREKELLDKINSYEGVLIYGAGQAGRTLYNYLMERECRVTIEFMVSSDNPGYTACGKPVKSIKHFVDRKDDVLVIIANKDNAGQMEETALQYQFKNIEIISYNELQLFGADMTKEKLLMIF